MKVIVEQDEPGEYDIADVLDRTRKAMRDAFPEFTDTGSGAYVSGENVGTIDIQFKRRSGGASN